MAEPLLQVENVSKRFGGLLAVDEASFTAEAGTHHRADRPERRRQDHAVLDHHRIPGADRGPHPSTTAPTSPASRRTSSRGAASPAPSRSCSRSRA